LFIPLARLLSLYHSILTVRAQIQRERDIEINRQTPQVLHHRPPLLQLFVLLGLFVMHLDKRIPQELAELLIDGYGVGAGVADSVLGLEQAQCDEAELLVEVGELIQYCDEGGEQVNWQREGAICGVDEFHPARLVCAVQSGD
ncbi:hypothetical protein K458DRAFT_451281, partial [Lentithecium fluviatile CBS 122367]